MKSDPGEMEAVACHAPRGILAALEDCVATLQPGQPARLNPLCALDPYGPEAFAAAARRFGLAPRTDGSWVLEKRPRWRPGWMTRDREAECLNLFEAAFGYRMDPRLWRWKYRDTPRPGMGVWSERQLVAFYGAMPRTVRFLGQPAVAAQIGDVMVLPGERGVLTRSGPFQIAASTFLERSMGYGRPYLFGFGFPTAKAFKVANKLGLYEEVDRIDELSWSAADSWGARLLKCDQLRPADLPTAERAWAAMERDFRSSILGVRDAAYIEQRYFRHPTVSYECLLVRRRLTGTVHGVLVMRRVDDEVIEWVDLIGERRHFPALVAAARGWAHRQRAARLRAWVTASHAHLFALTAPKRTPLDLVVPANVWSKGPSADELRNRWWLMAGDTDFR